MEIKIKKGKGLRKGRAKNNATSACLAETSSAWQGGQRDGRLAQLVSAHR